MLVFRHHLVCNVDHVDKKLCHYDSFFSLRILREPDFGHWKTLR